MTAILRCLLLLAVMARAMVPTGFMPAFAAESGRLFPLVICSGVTGDSTIYVTADQLPAEDGDTHPPAAHDAPCAFAAHFSAGATAAPPQLPPAVLDKTQPIPPAGAPPEARRNFKSYLSQGPPVSKPVT